MQCSVLAVVLLGLLGRSACIDSGVACSENSLPSGSSLLQRNAQHQAKHPMAQDSVQQSEPEYSSLLSRTTGNLAALLDVSDSVRSTLLSLPPETIAKMILPGPYPCELAWLNDMRFRYQETSLCGHMQLLEGMHPLNLSLSNHYRNSVRLLFPLGSLPCCPTPPHCMAPACKTPNPYVAPSYANLKCTKSPPRGYYGYLTHRDIWPAYFFRGGSSDIDVLKHWDVLARMLGCYDNSTGRCKNEEPFDLSLDLGADWGSFTERFSARKFAKDYIMLDCIPRNKDESQKRFNNMTFLDHWYGEQVVGWPAGRTYPQFEFLSFAVSNVSEGVFDVCDPAKTWGVKNKDGSPVPPCPVPIMAMDDVLPGKLSPAFQSKFQQAQSAYIKMDLDGMDQLGVDGMRRVLSERRGSYDDGTPRYLVDFMMLEFCPSCIVETRQEKQFSKYDLGTLVELYEKLGFELFLIGPHYIPLSHGSWIEDYNTLFSTPEKCPDSVTFDDYKSAACPAEGNCELSQCMQAADLFAMRSTHPHATEIKLSLGSCDESVEFAMHDEQYMDTLPSGS